MIARYILKYKQLALPVKAAMWFMICSVLQKSISLLTMPIFTRLMSTEQYGQFTAYNSWLQIFTILTTLRLNWAVFNKGMQKYRDDRDGYTSTMQSITFILTVLMLGIYILFQKQIDALTELPSFVMYAIFAELLVTPAIDFWTIRRRYEYIYTPIVAYTLLMALLNTALGLASVLLVDEKGYARILSCVFVNVCFGSVLFVVNLRRGKKLFCWDYAKYAIMFNLPLLLHYLSMYVLDQFSKIMVQKLAGVSALAIFGVACNLANVLKVVTNSLNNALVPWLHEKLETKQFNTLDNTMFLIFAGVAGVTLLVTALTPEIVFVFADPRYFDAIYCVPATILGMFFSFVYISFANVEFFYDKNKFTMYISITGAVLNVVLNYVGIRMFGYIAASYVTAICFAIFSFAHYHYMNYICREEVGSETIINGKRLLVLSVVLIVLTLGMNLLYGNIVLRYSLIAVAMVLIYIKRKMIVDILKVFSNKKQT